MTTTPRRRQRPGKRAARPRSSPDQAALAAQRSARASKLDTYAEVRDAYAVAADDATDRLLSGEISPRQWEAEMQDAVRDAHTAAYVAGRSGIVENVTPREWGRLGPVVRGQYGYLRRWRMELEATPGAERSEAAIRARARLYSAAARQSFERGVQDEIGAGGVPIPLLPAYPGDGSTDCRANCKCRWAVRILSKARGDYDVSWRMASAEHCPTCRARAKAWKKLKVRRGVLEDGYEPIVAAAA